MISSQKYGDSWLQRCLLISRTKFTSLLDNETVTCHLATWDMTLKNSLRQKCLFVQNTRRIPVHVEINFININRIYNRDPFGFHQSNAKLETRGQFWSTTRRRVLRCVRQVRRQGLSPERCGGTLPGGWHRDRLTHEPAADPLLSQSLPVSHFRVIYSFFHFSSFVDLRVFDRPLSWYQNICKMSSISGNIRREQSVTTTEQ